MRRVNGLLTFGLLADGLFQDCPSYAACADKSVKDGYPRHGLLLLGFLALCLLGLGLFGLTAYERNAQSDIEAALRTQQKLAALLERQRDAEEGRRGYMLTREPALLATFVGNQAGFGKDLSDLEADFADDPLKLAAMRRVRELSVAHDLLLGKILALHRAGQTVAPSVMDEPKSITDEMRAIIVGQIASEETQLRKQALVLKRRSTGLYLTLFLVNLWIVGLFVLVYRDVQRRLTQAIAMRDALKNANDSITAESERRQELEARLAHLQKMEAMGNLSSVIAHDFKNMIGGIALAVENVRGRVSPRDLVAQDDINLALSGTSKATDLANRLLMLNRKQALHARPINLNAVIIDLSDLLYRTIGRNRPIDVVLGEDLAMVLADPEQLETAIINLCLNAREAMPTGGSITIATRNLILDEPWTPRYPEAPPGEYVALMVSDTGGGMSPGIVARAFDPFYSTKDDADGLGLSQVHSFVRQSRGHIAIFSAEGRGTTMKIILPRIPDPSE